MGSPDAARGATAGGAERGGPAPRADPGAYARAVLAVTGLIPAGHVLSYGDVAELLGVGGPRQVGRALSHSTREIPWWRVVRADGHPAHGLALRARAHYDVERTPLRVPAGATGLEDYRVELTTARWWPGTAEQDAVETLSRVLRPAGGRPRSRGPGRSAHGG